MDVKWIKLYTDMFDNRKIKHLRKLPDGNSIALLWVMLLTMAGRCNANGKVYLTENFPYTTKMLADELDFEENTIKMALSSFEILGMIERKGDLIIISGWDEYQNIDRLSEIREYNRLAKQRQRAKQKALPDVNDMSMTSQRCQDTDIDIDIDIDKDKEKRKEKNKRFTPPTLEEVQAYCKERKNNVDAERFVDYYASQKWKKANGQPVADWKACIRTWEKRSNVGANGVKLSSEKDDILDGIL